MPYSEKTKLARKGRDGDTLLGHLTPGDVIISRERQERDPEFRAKLREIMGDDLERFTAGSAWNSKNPRTGLAEFAEGGGAGGGGDSSGGGDTSGGGGGTDPGNTGGAGLGGLGLGGVDTSSTGTGPTGAGFGTDVSHAAEVAASPAGDPTSSNAGLTAGDPNAVAANERTNTLGGQLGALAAGALSSLGFNTTDEPGLGLTPGINSNILGTAASLAPGPIGTAGTLASATGLTNRVGELAGLATPERGLFGTVADLADPTGASFGPGPGEDTGLGPDRKGDVWSQIFAGLTPGAVGAPPPPQAAPPGPTHKQEDAALLALQGIPSNSPMSLEAARALLGEG